MPPLLPLLRCWPALQPRPPTDPRGCVLSPSPTHPPTHWTAGGQALWPRARRAGQPRQAVRALQGPQVRARPRPPEEQGLQGLSWVLAGLCARWQRRGGGWRRRRRAGHLTTPGGLRAVCMRGAVSTARSSPEPPSALACNPGTRDWSAAEWCTRQGRAGQSRQCGWRGRLRQRWRALLGQPRQLRCCCRRSPKPAGSRMLESEGRSLHEMGTLQPTPTGKRRHRRPVVSCTGKGLARRVFCAISAGCHQANKAPCRPCKGT